MKRLHPARQRFIEILRFRLEKRGKCALTLELYKRENWLTYTLFSFSKDFSAIVVFSCNVLETNFYEEHASAL
jgi:hypothetical protein